MNKKLTKTDQQNIDKWLLTLIHKVEENKLSKEQILNELKELRKYFFN